MQDFRKLISGVTTFGELYGILNNNLDAVRSQFSGIQFPENPTTGQPCFRTDMNPARLFLFDGGAWVDFASASPGVAALTTEVTAARGDAATLNARLSVSLNPDGTLKGDAPASDWWNPEPDPDDIARVSDTAFSVAGDKRQIYTPRRGLLLTFEGDATLGTWVQETAYDTGADRTQVTISAGAIATTPVDVEFGQPVGNEPRISTATDTEPGLTRAIKDSEAQAGALDPALFGLPYITLTALNILVKKAVSPLFQGLILPLPYRLTELPFGWRFCNGDLYPLDSDVGKALSAFSNNYKVDWGIAVYGQSIGIPNMFYTDGRGYFVRMVNGSTRQVGSVQNDTMRPITGTAPLLRSGSGPNFNGALYGTGTNIMAGGSTAGGGVAGIMLDSSRMGPNYSGTETTPLNIGMIPAIYLGV